MSITKQELYRHAADNLEKGLPELDRVEYFMEGKWKPSLIMIHRIAERIDQGVGEKYRIRPKTKLVNGFEVPNISYVPDVGDWYFSVNIRTVSPTCAVKNRDNRTDKRIIDAGMAYPRTDDGRAAAKAHALAILGIDPNGGEE